MKLQEQFRYIKQTFPDYVILIKRGTFYTAYQNDAYILHELFGYQLQDERVGFPITGIEKVLEKLAEKHINVFKSDDELKMVYDDNHYKNILYQSKKNYFDELNAKVLLEEIDFLLKNNPENITRIKNFINEL